MSDVHFPPSATSPALPEAREESDGPVRRQLHGIPDIRGFFRTNTAPVYFFGPTAFNLLGIDRWVRNHTVESFGPVRAVEPGLVFEVAFDAVQRSTRHKSGLAMRFPRIHRIRWDKPAAEADRLETLMAMIE